MNSDELDKIQILGISDVLYDIEKDFHKIEVEFSESSKIQLNIEQNIQTNSPLFENQVSVQPKEIENETIVMENSDLSEEPKIEETKPTEIVDKTVDLVDFSKLEEPEENQIFKTQAKVQENQESNLQKEDINQVIQKTVPETTLLPPKRKVVTSCTFSLVNPVTGKVIMGKVRKYKYPVLLFIPNNLEEIKNLRFGQIFENCNLKQVVENQELSSNHRCQIRGISDNSIEFCLLR
jgi:hypothetical protein